MTLILFGKTSYSVYGKKILFQGDCTALSAACQKGHAETARVLLEKGANIDYQDNVRTVNKNTIYISFDKQLHVLC